MISQKCQFKLNPAEECRRNTFPARLHLGLHIGKTRFIWHLYGHSIQSVEFGPYEKHRQVIMPEVSRFFGIVIRMYFDDHPPPHFHAYYGEHEAIVGISPIHVIDGRLPRRALSLVYEWAALHQSELQSNWTMLSTNQPVRGIEPLE